MAPAADNTSLGSLGVPRSHSRALVTWGNVSICQHCEKRAMAFRWHLESMIFIPQSSHLYIYIHINYYHISSYIYICINIYIISIVIIITIIISIYIYYYHISIYIYIYYICIINLSVFEKAPLPTESTHFCQQTCPFWWINWQVKDPFLEEPIDLGKKWRHRRRRTAHFSGHFRSHHFLGDFLDCLTLGTRKNQQLV